MHKALGLIPVPHPHNHIHTPKKKKKKEKGKKIVKSITSKHVCPLCPTISMYLYTQRTET
jgi:hypothetical protein